MEEKESINVVSCPYINKCKSYPFRCQTCKHNRSRKLDYYDPDTDRFVWGGQSGKVNLSDEEVDEKENDN